MLLCFIHAIGVCEPWCSNPCTELNGAVHIECGDCTVETMKCRPGTAGFSPPATSDVQPAPQEKKYNPMGMEMKMDATQRYQVQSTGAADLFTMSDSPRDEISSYYSDATSSDEAAEIVGRRASGRDTCESAACARVQLQRLRGANARVLPSGGNVTAGGEVVPCEFQVTDREALRAMPLAERREMLNRFPTLIRGLTDEWPAMARWADPQAFSRRFGHHMLKAIRASHGFGRLVSLGGQQCNNFDEGRCPGQANATLPLAEILPFSHAEQLVLMDLPDMNRGEHELLTDVTLDYEPPEFLGALSNIRLLSIGGRAEGRATPSHDRPPYTPALHAARAQL